MHLRHPVPLDWPRRFCLSRAGLPVQAAASSWVLANRRVRIVCTGGILLVGDDLEVRPIECILLSDMTLSLSLSLSLSM